MQASAGEALRISRGSAHACRDLPSLCRVIDNHLLSGRRTFSTLGRIIASAFYRGSSSLCIVRDTSAGYGEEFCVWDGIPLRVNLLDYLASQVNS